MEQILIKVKKNEVVTINVDAYEDCSRIENLGKYFVLVNTPDNATIKILCFSLNKSKVAFRYSSNRIGAHKYSVYKKSVNCDDKKVLLNGEILVRENNTGNMLYQKGGVGKSEKGRHLVYLDKTPFFWLADTCWMLFCDRLEFPEDYLKILKDRAEKGFTVIMLVAGLYPDMDLFDERGISGGGFPFEKNLEYFDIGFFEKADKIIAMITELGMVPCILGSWGYYADLLGKDLLIKHWEHILARWNSYPVIWCIAGEALMPYYIKNESISTEEEKHRYTTEMKKYWSKISKVIHASDSYGRLITIHPDAYGHKQINNEEDIELNMLQTGHSSFSSLLPALDKITKAFNETKLPVINGENCYEGICGGNDAEIVRFSFWSCVLSGCCGHSYGANGIWQCNNIDKPYGASPHGVSWGDRPWQEALDLIGSFQVGLGSKLLQKYRWWEFKIHTEWVENYFDYKNPTYSGAFCAGITREVRIIFKPFVHGYFWGEDYIVNIEKDVIYSAFYFDPIKGDIIDIGEVVPDESGRWKSPRVKKFQDWILVMESAV